MKSFLRRASLLAALLSFCTMLVVLMPEAGSADGNGPRFGQVRLRTGVQLHYAEQGNASAQPVILLHGYSDSWFSYSLVLKNLPASLHVYALDQRGHGDSGRPESGYAMTDLAADVIAFMDAKGITKATVIGHSMGGFVAQRVAQAAPERAARLVLISTATAGRNIAGMQDLKAAVDAFTDSVPESFMREFQVSTVHTTVPVGFIDRAVAESSKLPVRVWRGIAQGLMDDARPDTWIGVSIPTLIFWGERDTYATRAEQDALLALIPRATLKTYGNTGHALHWERPAEFTRDLLAFLSSN